jgi:hypothetical protein
VTRALNASYGDSSTDIVGVHILCEGFELRADLERTFSDPGSNAVGRSKQCQAYCFTISLTPRLISLAPQPTGYTPVLGRKYTTCIASVIVAATCFLLYRTKTNQPPRSFLNDVPSFVCMQVGMNYGLIASTIPTLKAWVGAFNTGWGTRDNAGVGGCDDSSYQLSMDRTSNTNNQGGAKIERGSRALDRGCVPFRHGQNRARTTASHQSGDGRSSEESDGSTRMIIHHVKL